MLMSGRREPPLRPPPRLGAGGPARLAEVQEVRGGVVAAGCPLEAVGVALAVVRPCLLCRGPVQREASRERSLRPGAGAPRRRDAGAVGVPGMQRRWLPARGPSQ